MPNKYRVTGERQGSPFSAPVEADSAEEAIETFEEQVNKPDDFDGLEAEVWR